MLDSNVRNTSLTIFGAVVALALLPAGPARADSKPSAVADDGLAATLRLRPLHLADVVVQTPPPAQPTVVEPTPVATDVGPRKVVQTDTHSHNYVGTIAWSAIGGAVLGALVGTANIAYWAAGGVLVGAGVGVVQVMVEESRTSSALSLHAPRDPAPTLRLALYQYRF
jgi:hypothetical protein